MNIKILDSWLREFLDTPAKPKDFAEKLSLTSVSIERVEKWSADFLYDIEVTTNRIDLSSVVGLAREASAVLPQFGLKAKFVPPQIEKPKVTDKQASITIENDPKLVNRVCAVVMEIQVKEPLKDIKDRLEAAGIRSLNNIIDVTNYVMRTIGHPAHVFDFDRLNTSKLIIRESKKGEEIITLDAKKHTLPGGDIVATDEKGRIVDLLGIMGLENSVVTNETKRILFFIDNNDPKRMRKTSMNLAIRSEAAQLNEKGIDPELAYDALLYGVKLYEKIADGKVISDIIDIYPNKPKQKTISISQEKINQAIGITLPIEKSEEILSLLGFGVTVENDAIKATVPSFRASDMEIPEDLIEEIARVYGYHNLPSVLPQIISPNIRPIADDPLYWEKRAKETLKYWGFTETYTYSMVPESMYEGPLTDAVKIKNPLDEDHVYMRKTLVPSLLQVVFDNKNYKTLSLFEIANTYAKKTNDLPTETRMLAGIIKKPHVSIYEVKGIIEQLLADMGIKHTSFKITSKGGIGASVYIEKEYIGEIEVFDDELIDFELNFEKITAHATLKKTYIPLSKFPPVIEDLALVINESVSTGDIIDLVRKQSPLITHVSLLDKYGSTRTFHVLYQDKEKNLTNEEVGEVRTKILKTLAEKFNASLKE